jgi:hypothetical protein
MKGLIMSNPIPKNNFCATPESLEAFQDYLDLFTGKEKAVATLAACMAFNLAHKLVEEQSQPA